MRTPACGKGTSDAQRRRAADKRLFGDGTIPRGLKLVNSQSYATRVIVANYEPAGEVKTGDFQLTKPSEAEFERRRNLI
jgi:hypothetical protein